MPESMTDGRGASRGWSTVAVVFASELAAALLVVAARRPALAVTCVAAGGWFAVRWLRRRRQAIDAATKIELVFARVDASRAPSPGEAIRILERTRGRTPLDQPAARLLIELYARVDDLDQAVAVALEHLDLLDPDDVRNMIASLQAWGHPRYAADLAVAAAFGQRIATRNSRGNENSRFPSLRAG